MTNRSLIRILEREREAFAAERKLLIEQICHLSRYPWTPSPADMATVYERLEEDETDPLLVQPQHWTD
jgi:hypothetical protein